MKKFPLNSNIKEKPVCFEVLRAFIPKNHLSSKIKSHFININIVIRNQI